MSQFVTRQIGTMQFAAGTRQTMDVDRDGVLHQINLNISFDITGVAATAGPLNQTLARVITRLELIVDGQDTVVNITGEGLASRQYSEFGAYPLGMDAAIVVGAATTSYNIVLAVPLFLPRARRPDDASIDCRRIRQLQLAVTWQAQGLADFFTTPGALATYQNLVCAVEGMYSVNVDPAKTYLVRAMDYVFQDVPATNGNLPVLCDRGDLFYRSFHIVADAAELAINNMINNIRLESGSFVFANRQNVQMRAGLIRDFGLPIVSGQPFPQQTGTYRIETTIWGEGGSMIAVALLSADLYLRFDVTKQAGVNTLKIFRESVRALRT